MEKIVTIESKVDDLWGLYADLRRAAFSVKNVGQDKRGTHIYLDPKEEKDPLEIARNWVGKKAPVMSSSVKKNRAKDYQCILEQDRVLEEARKAEEDKISAQLKVDEMSAISNTMDLGNKPISFKDDTGNVIGEFMEGNPADAAKQEPIYKRIWKALF